MTQLTRRKPAMRLEAALARNPNDRMLPGFPNPPVWALRASLCALASITASMQRYGPEGGPITAGHLGVLVGMSSMFAAHLKNPDSENLELEKPFPELTAYRQQLADLVQSEFEETKEIETTVPSLPLSPSALSEYRQGQMKGAELVDTDREFLTIRAEVCYFLWLYWDQITNLRTLSSLMDFLTEFEVRGLTQKNLEKICRQIGYRAKGRGRPKNLLRSPSK